MLYELVVESPIYSKEAKSEVRQLEVEKETEKTYKIKSGSRLYRNTIKKSELGTIQTLSEVYVIWFTDISTLEDHKATIMCLLNDVISNHLLKVKRLQDMKEAIIKVKGM